MIERRQGSPLTARGHIRGTEVADNRDAGQLCQQRSIPDLPGAALLRFVENGLPVEADRAHLARLQPRRREQGSHRVRMAVGQFLLDRLHFTLPVHQGPQTLAEADIIGKGLKKTRFQPLQTIRLEQSGIDSIQRSSAHQTEKERHPAASTINSSLGPKDPAERTRQPGCAARPQRCVAGNSLRQVLKTLWHEYRNPTMIEGRQQPAHPAQTEPWQPFRGSPMSLLSPNPPEVKVVGSSSHG